MVSNSRSKTDCLQSVRNIPKFVRLKVEGPSGRVYATTNVLFGLVTSTIHFRRPPTFQRTGIFTILESWIWTWTRTIIIFSYNNSQKSKSEKITSSNHSRWWFEIVEKNVDMSTCIFPDGRHGRGQITDTRVHRTLVCGYGLWLHYPSLSVNVVKSIKLKGDR